MHTYNNIKQALTLKKLGIVLSVLFLFSFISAGYATNTALDNHATTASKNDAKRIFEMRTYTSNEGKLSALHARFRDHTLGLFEKHGMQNIGYWIPADKKNTLVYIVAHNSEESAKASWQNFINDEQWKKAYQASIADGALVANIESVFMQATDYSPIQ